jgi:hypothetical protein
MSCCQNSTAEPLAVGFPNLILFLANAIFHYTYTHTGGVIRILALFALLDRLDFRDEG